MSDELVFNVNNIEFADMKIYRKIATVKAVKLETEFCVETIEGPLRGNKGDYLCEGIEGERWPVKAEIFDKTYEIVDSCNVKPEAAK